MLAEAADEYVFSTDVEVRALEKKIRNAGRALGRRGIDVEQLFRSYDARESGMIRRTEFIEVLCKIGQKLVHETTYDILLMLTLRRALRFGEGQSD